MRPFINLSFGAAYCFFSLPFLKLWQELKVCNNTFKIIWTRRSSVEIVFEECRAIRIFLKAAVIQIVSIVMFETRTNFWHSNSAALKSYWHYFCWKSSKKAEFNGVFYVNLRRMQIHLILNATLLSKKTCTNRFTPLEISGSTHLKDRRWQCFLLNPDTSSKFLFRFVMLRCQTSRIIWTRKRLWLQRFWGVPRRQCFI